MTKKQLKQKVKECIKTDKALIEKLIDKAIDSGSMDIEGAENNYLLAKYTLSAIYKEMSRQYSPLHAGRKAKEDIHNIYIHL